LSQEPVCVGAERASLATPHATTMLPATVPLTVTVAVVAETPPSSAVAVCLIGLAAAPVKAIAPPTMAFAVALSGYDDDCWMRSPGFARWRRLTVDAPPLEFELTTSAEPIDVPAYVTLVMVSSDRFAAELPTTSSDRRRN
jgi:hypothetical protein